MEKSSGTTAENNSNKSKEAPAALSGLRPIYGPGWERRTKSVSDVRDIEDEDTK